MTSLVLRTQSVSAVYFLPSSFLLKLSSVEQHCELNEKSEQVQQANVFKRQTMFHFSTYRPNSFKHLSHHSPVWPHEGIDHCDRCIGRRNNTATRFFPINTFSTMSKLFTPNRYYYYYYYYYTYIHTFRTRASSVMILNQRCWQSLGGQHCKDVDWIFEKMSFQTVFEGVESGWKSDVNR